MTLPLETILPLTLPALLAGVSLAALLFFYTRFRPTAGRHPL